MLMTTTQLRIPSNRSFGLTFSAVFAVIACQPLLSGGSVRVWSLLTSAVFFVLSICYPTALHGMNLLWARFGLIMQQTTNPIILALLFFCVLVPFGLIMRLFRKDVLHLRRQADVTSYWIDSIEINQPGKKSMQNQF